MPTARSRTELLAFAALLAMTAAWGSTFFLIKDIVTRIPVSDLLAVRFAIASLALLLIAGRRLRMSRETVRRGVLLGVLYGIAQLLQTAGLAQTAASVSGFITGLYVVATPLLSAVILRTRIAGTTWLAVGLATLGLGVLSLQGSRDRVRRSSSRHRWPRERRTGRPSPSSGARSAGTTRRISPSASARARC